MVNIQCAHGFIAMALVLTPNIYIAFLWAILNARDYATPQYNIFE
jgi:hypothetical protein